MLFPTKVDVHDLSLFLMLGFLFDLLGRYEMSIGKLVFQFFVYANLILLAVRSSISILSLCI